MCDQVCAFGEEGSFFPSSVKGGIRQSNEYPSSRSILKVPLSRVTIKSVTKSTNKADHLPHVATVRVQTDVTAVLERRLSFGQDWLLSDNSATPHCFQSPGETENFPIPFTKLNRHFGQIF